MNKFEIVDCIKDLIKDKENQEFYPIQIAKLLRTGINPVLEGLQTLVNLEILNLKYEIKCSNKHLLKTVNNYAEDINSNVYCKKCNEYYFIKSENIYPKYFVSDSYKEYLKNKTQF